MTHKKAGYHDGAYSDAERSSGLGTLRDVWPGQEPRSWSPPPEVPLQPNPALCPATGKFRHPRKVEALTQLEALMDKSPDELMAVYVCKHCFSWHVGHV